MSLKIANIRLTLDESEERLPELLASRLGVAAANLGHWRILRKSLDARRHDEIHFLYSAEVAFPGGEAEEARILRHLGAPDPLALDTSNGVSHDRGKDSVSIDDPQYGSSGVTWHRNEQFDWPIPGNAPMHHRPVVIGAGPAGLFAGYFLALAGYRPIVLERGKAVKDRVADVRAFDAGGELNPESNYLFGEGGAGTFSDGKLTCRATGPDVQRVLELFVECHGKPSLLYEHRPHLGSNRLPLIVRTIRKKLEELGGEVRFQCRFEDIEINEGQLRAVHTGNGRIAADAAVLATGHSARDVYEMLHRRGVPMEFKPFQLGVRIEQPQSDVNQARYGPYAAHPKLGAADYTLTAHLSEKDLFTFCMCAGGYVMPSISDPEHFCTNGMSESYHDSPFANSGLVMTIGPRDLAAVGLGGADATHPLAGVWYQKRVEQSAYRYTSNSYRAPIQWARDLLGGRSSRGEIPSSFPKGRGVMAGDLSGFLPEVVMRALSRGLPKMDRQMRGMFLKNATITGPESRGSSPVRVTRDNQTRQSPGIAGLYPCGEGAGFAGGIVSAAVDGLRVARAMVRHYAKPV